MSDATLRAVPQASQKSAHLDAFYYDYEAELVVLYSIVWRSHEGALDELEGRGAHLFHNKDYQKIFYALDSMRLGKVLVATATELKQALVINNPNASEKEIERIAQHVLVQNTGIPVFSDINRYWAILERKAGRRAVLDASEALRLLANDRSETDLAVIQRHNERPRILLSGDEPVIDPTRQWPKPLGDAAYYGLTGELARMIDPHTEADPAAIIVQFLVEFGSVIGRGVGGIGPHWSVEADRHYLNEFCVLVGDTSKGRKGTSEGHIRRVVGSLDTRWLSECRSHGFTSGEALIEAVCDPIEKEGKDDEKIIVKAGVHDKRLMIVESEYARVLTVGRRDSNTLSMIIRAAWDSGDLRATSKGSPAKATGAHVSVIGHITKDELRSKLTETDQANGFGNRHLWVCSRRSKELPDGGAIDEVDFSSFHARFREAFRFAQDARRIKRDQNATALWRELYSELSAGAIGLFGAMTSRAEAHVMRLACIYALLDQKSAISVEHLKGAFEVWRYSRDSCEYLFGRRLGDALAEEILALACQVRSEGLTRTQLSNQLGRNYSAERLAGTLKSLAENGLIRLETVANAGRGPKAMRIFAV